MAQIRLLLPLLLVFVAGCAIQPPPQPAASQMCAFLSYDLAVEQPPNFGDVTTERRTLGDVLNEALFRTPQADAAPPSESMLFLSGGSLHGAFGAGFLDQWKRLSTPQHLPDFKVVTGISTGAILSTFAFVDMPERAVEGYTIESESDLLKPFGAVKKGEPATSSYIALLRKGALADLAPLRDRLHGFIDDAMLRKVAGEGTRGRKLLIGVVDVDTGQAVVLDLTDMARQYVAAADAVRAGTARADATDPERKRDCYVEGILASSSAPLAALPVFIDNRMYVDGGARFGVFSDEIGDEIERNGDSSAKPTIYVLINGDQEIAGRCGKADPAHCRHGDPAGNVLGAHAGWTFPQLAVRSERILTNQVYRFSSSAIAVRAKERGMVVREIKIDADMMEHRFPRAPAGSSAAGSRSCAEWRTFDRDSAANPLQFFPNYMRCLIDYGRFQAARKLPQWQEEDRPDPFGG
ncbi:MAG: patatin-like phospholipase family protein [Novosphingobium sp.]